jgi:hypothetical protein
MNEDLRERSMKCICMYSVLVVDDGMLFVTGKENQDENVERKDRKSKRQRHISNNRGNQRTKGEE